MSLYLGILSDSYRRQLRRVTDRPRIDVVLEKVEAIARDFGIHPLGIDFSVSQLASTTCGYLDELKARLKESQLIPTVIIGSLMLSADRDLSEPPLLRAIESLEIAHTLGSPLGLYYFSYGGRVTREGRVRLAVEQVRRLADAARPYGLTVTTENYDFFTSQDFLRIFQEVGRDNVGLHNDTGNWLILGEDPLTATRALASYTYHAHVRDYVLRDGIYTSVPIGQGVVDFPSVLAELKRIGRARQRFVLAMEMDLDEGDADTEDTAVRACTQYMVDWLARNQT
jgi:sugar phosphate isomerase/epimerase